MPIDPTQALVATRSAIGISSWVAPGLAGRAFGLDVPGNPQAPYLARLFGVRDLAFGVGVQRTPGDARRLRLTLCGACHLGAKPPPGVAPRPWLPLGAPCDLADPPAGVLSGRDGSLPKVSAALV